MAPPVNRRTGYSRRAQYGTFLAYVFGVLGAVAGGAALLLAGGNATFGTVRGAIDDATAGPARVSAQAKAGGGRVLDVLGGYFTSGAEVARLRREVALARVRLAEQAAMADENRRLKAALGLSASDRRAVATAWLIASSGSSMRRYAVISAGAGDGVRVGMPVRTAFGVVGRVLETGERTARILLISDSESVVPVRRARDGVPAFTTGRPDGTLQVRLISLGLNPLRVGDALVTSGAGGLYWPGTPIAVVTALTHDGAIARVLADPASSEFVTVEPEWNTVRDATLPPPPDPTARRPKKR